MNKDVIYIDVEDDITAIIGKVKSAKEKIVALVPPKRIGVLQSAVNLRLLARAAGQANKHLVVITNNPALSALSAAALLPVAKNLQSKPGLADIPALDIDDGEDVIDGAQLPVGELVKTADTPQGRKVIPVSDNTGTDTAVDDIAKAAAPSVGGTLAKPKAKSGVKVPNFNIFRKKLLLLIGGGILLIGFLIWAIFIAPRATVLITARTTDSSVNSKVTFDSTAKTDLTSNVIRSATQQIKKDDSIEFDATGKKDVGDTAKGNVKLSKLSPSATSIPAGSQLTSTAGLVFTTDTDTTIPPSTPCFPSFCAQSVTVGVTAAASGTKYNGATGALSGAPSSASASFVDASAGGTDKVATIVTADDIQKATDALLQKNNDDMKTQLKTQFGAQSVVLDSSFMSSQTGATSTPAVNQELVAGAGKAKLSASLTYTMVGIDKSEIKTYLDAYFNKQLTDQNSQRIYGDGLDKVTFTNVNAPTDGKPTANIVATAQVGPKIDDAVIKSTAMGKRYGEIQSAIEGIQGVNNVDVQFWPFWVTSAPNDTSKINVEFKLDASN
ncbi:MAG: hypothetical protein ABIQ04_00465 [Candidatus Saccharimonadales bacterium]